MFLDWFCHVPQRNHPATVEPTASSSSKEGCARAETAQCAASTKTRGPGQRSVLPGMRWGQPWTSKTWKWSRKDSKHFCPAPLGESFCSDLFGEAAPPDFCKGFSRRSANLQTWERIVRAARGNALAGHLIASYSHPQKLTSTKVTSPSNVILHVRLSGSENRLRKSSPTSPKISQESPPWPPRGPWALPPAHRELHPRDGRQRIDLRPDVQRR